MNAFSIAKLPRIEFGCGKISKLPELISQFPAPVLIVTGGRFLVETEAWQTLIKTLELNKVRWFQHRIIHEPSPQLVDDAVREFKGKNIGLVVAIGGGSTLDAAKAIAGLLNVGQSVMDFLEGVGPELPYQGPSVPFVAVPTTAGTGSEATKNAVLSVIDKQQGFKKSFRDDKLVAEYTIVDPDLLRSCPQDLIAANGMDALTQLIESYVSLKANPFTDSLAYQALDGMIPSLVSWFNNEADTEARSKMAYGALVSGITLAQVGLGSVHGLASPMGAFFPIPHGVVCGTLLASATRVNIESMQAREPDNVALEKYAQLGRLFAGQQNLDADKARESLLVQLDELTNQLKLPQFSEWDVTQQDIPQIVKHSRGSSMKTNPIVLSDSEITQIVASRL